MAEKITELELDVKKEKIKGFQKLYCPALLDVMKEAIGQGQNLPRVDVVYKEGVYQLLHGLNCIDNRSSNYGGHHRTLSYILFNGEANMPCNLFSDHNTELKSCDIVDVLDMQPSEEIFWPRVREALRFLPRKSAIKLVDSFFEKYDLKSRRLVGL